MSREALSLDISRLVSRVVSGETIDTVERGAALAEKYPDLGMNAALISQAIERAAGMVGMIRNTPEPPKPVRAPSAAPAQVSPPVPAPKPAEAHRPAPPAPIAPRMPVAPLPVSSRSIEDDLAAAIDAEIGNLVYGHRAKPAPAPKPEGTRLTPSPSLGAARAAAPAAARQNGEKHAVAKPIGGRSAPAMRKPEPAAATAVQPAVSSTPAVAPAAAEPRSESPQSLFASFRRALFRN